MLEVEHIGSEAFACSEIETEAKPYQNEAIVSVRIVET